MLGVQQLTTQGYQRAKLLSQEECTLLRSLEKIVSTFGIRPAYKLYC